MVWSPPVFDLADASGAADVGFTSVALARLAAFSAFCSFFFSAFESSCFGAEALSVVVEDATGVPGAASVAREEASAGRASGCDAGCDSAVDSEGPGLDIAAGECLERRVSDAVEVFCVEVGRSNLESINNAVLLHHTRI